MPIWRIPVYWQVGGVCKIEAPTLDEAIKLVPYSSYPGIDYDDDTITVDDVGENYIRENYNENHEDEAITSANRLINLGEKVEIISTGEICKVTDTEIGEGKTYYLCRSAGGLITSYLREQLRPNDVAEYRISGLCEIFEKTQDENGNKKA